MLLSYLLNIIVSLFVSLEDVLLGVSFGICNVYAVIITGNSPGDYVYLSTRMV